MSNMVLFITVLFLSALVSVRGGDAATVSEKIKAEIAKMADDVQQIIGYLNDGPGKGQSYERLAVFTDTIGHRLAGSAEMDQAVEYMLSAMHADGLENVHGESASIPRWTRGSESATMFSPRTKNLAILGLGSSVGTPIVGITAPVIVVKTFDELRSRGEEARGKIVVFNQAWQGSYGATVEYRTRGAVEAAKVGALAALIRSVTQFSLYTPHTGSMRYEDGVEKIPGACITVEDAELMQRMTDRGQEVVVQLQMEARTHANVESMNVVAEIKGSTYPEQVVLVSGHLDSWDVGQGAMDDGGGALISWQALSVIKHLGLRPKRTLRAVLWNAEEIGAVGALNYYNEHKMEVADMDMVMESDSGVFYPTGLEFTGSEEATAILAEIMRYMEPFNASAVLPGGGGADITFWIQDGVPGGSLGNRNEKYFDYHHTEADTMTVLDPSEMDKCATLWAIAAYCVANLDEMLPR